MKILLKNILFLFISICTIDAISIQILNKKNKIEYYIYNELLNQEYNCNAMVTEIIKNKDFNTYIMKSNNCEQLGWLNDNLYVAKNQLFNKNKNNDFFLLIDYDKILNKNNFNIKMYQSKAIYLKLVFSSLKKNNQPERIYEKCVKILSSKEECLQEYTGFTREGEIILEIDLTSRLFVFSKNINSTWVVPLQIGLHP